MLLTNQKNINYENLYEIRKETTPFIFATAKVHYVLKNKLKISSLTHCSQRHKPILVIFLQCIKKPYFFCFLHNYFFLPYCL